MGIVHSGQLNPNWKGGRSIASNGYVLIRVGIEHHLADVRGYAYEHRLVAEKKLGRRLKRGESIHHVNGKKADNRPENIDVKPSFAHHALEHRSEKNRERLRKPGEKNQTVTCACGCGAKFKRYDASGRPRKFVSGHNAYKT